MTVKERILTIRLSEKLHHQTKPINSLIISEAEKKQDGRTIIVIESVNHQSVQ